MSRKVQIGCGIIVSRDVSPLPALMMIIQNVKAEVASSVFVICEFA